MSTDETPTNADTEGAAAAASAPTATDNNDDDTRGNWDQTSRKVIVRNVLKYLRAKDVEKMATKWLEGHESQIKIVRTKKPPKDSWVKVTLAEDSMVEPFIQLINAGGEGGNAMSNARGKPLCAKRANDDGGGGDGDRKRKGRDGDDDGRDGKRPGRTQQTTRILSTDEVRDKITPMWKTPYEEQLEAKGREMVLKCAAKIVKEIRGKFRILEKEVKRGQRKSCPKTYDWLAARRAVEVEPPLPSPQKYEYRNKCEFTMGYRLVAPEGGDGGEEAAVVGDEAVEGADEVPATTTQPDFIKIPAAGFLAQGWSGGVYPPHCLQNMPDWSCGVCDLLNEFLPASPVPPYDSKVHRGVWRTVTLRCSLRTRELMVVVQHAPATGGAGAREDGSDDHSKAFEGEKRRLVEALTKGVIPTPERDYPEDHDGKEGGGEGKEEGLRVTSIFFQEFGGVSQPKPDHPVQHAYGKKCLEEKLGKCTFQISPGAFFQVNTEGAEVLYDIVVERIKEVAKTNPEKTLLLDVCCGTGTIGLTCLKEGVVGRLVGVDISEPAIADAEINAAANGYTKTDTTSFIASAAEKALPDVVRGIPRDEPVVAVVDPARDGLHPLVVRALRAKEEIGRLVYVSCNPATTLVRDAAMLCGPPTKRYPGRPFKIALAQPVDMFPLTKHCEMVMTFDRMSEEEYEGYHGEEK